MANVLNHDDSITVTAYSLHEFAFELCDLAAKGFMPTMENDKAARIVTGKQIGRAHV